MVIRLGSRLRVSEALWVSFTLLFFYTLQKVKLKRSSSQKGI